jgi:RHS repeat-associated protein
MCWVDASRFTGKERDAETGLDYFGARYMSSAQGRFTSPDLPLYDQHPTDPQSWNLYSYVRNNPLIYTDPDGRGCVGEKGNIDDPSVPGPSCKEIAEQDKKVKPSVTVTAKQGSLWAFLTAPQVPRYVPNEVELPSSSRQVLSNVYQNTWPIAQPLCNAGAFVYAGGGTHSKSGHEALEVFSVTDANLSGSGLQISQGILVEGAVELGPLSVAHGREASVVVYGKGKGHKHEASLSFAGGKLKNGLHVQGMVDWSSPGIGVVAGGESFGAGAYVSPSFIKGCK